MIEIMISTAERLIWSYLTIPLLISISLVFTFYLKGSQFQFKKMVRSLAKKTPNSRVSPLQSLALALASRVGVGSLAGVSLAIYTAGPGSIFWMWISVFITTAASFIESTLAQIYKMKDQTGFVGGPAYYIQNGLKNRTFAMIYALVIILAYTLGFSAVQMNTIATSFESSLSIPPIITGIALAVVTSLIIFGGISAITKLVSKVVPIVAIFYVGLGLVVFLTHLNYVPTFITTIITDAFKPAPFVGGTMMFTVLTGMKRGIFSNEAGLGSGAHAAAVTNNEYPTEQGYIQAFGVYLTTLIVVTITAFLIMVTDAANIGIHSGNGIELTEFAMIALFGRIGGPLLALSIFFFGFSTVLTAYFYGEANVKFLTNNYKMLIALRLLVIGVVFISAISSARMIWSLVDIGTGVTAIINLFAILLLSSQVKSYLAREQL